MPLKTTICTHSSLAETLPKSYHSQQNASTACTSLSVAFFLPIFVAESHHNSGLSFIFFFQQQIPCISSHPVLFPVSLELFLTFLFFSYHQMQASRNSYQLYLQNLSGILPLYSIFPAIDLCQKFTVSHPDYCDSLLIVSLLSPLSPAVYSPPISHGDTFSMSVIPYLLSNLFPLSLGIIQILYNGS